nr:hypothetical protein GCM10020092_036090 [Actinoplanes digitatis]
MLDAFLYLHIVLMVFWLGGDLGVFYSSRYVIDPALAPAARLTALKIMSGLDLGPKICLILFLPSGLTLISLDPHGGYAFGMKLLPWWLLVAAWLGALVWLWLMYTDHHEPGLAPADPPDRRGDPGRGDRRDGRALASTPWWRARRSASTPTRDGSAPRCSATRWRSRRASASGARCARSARPSPR